MRVECDNCDWEGDNKDIFKPVWACEGLFELMAPGEEMAAGECPRCGALACVVKDPIVISIKGGVIQEITGIPHRLNIIVRNYDIDGIEVEKLLTDANGNKCVESVVLFRGSSYRRD